MKEINIANAIIYNRKKMSITQDDLANYIGVSKASVSKWETGQSYPDITFLPKLATFFNISIDKLIDYNPQMTKEDLRKLYITLSSDFANKPFDEVISECRRIVKDYFSCFPLLFQIGSLILNNSVVLKDSDKSALLIKEAKNLFVRIKKESDDVELAKQALFLEAMCTFTLGNPDETLELLSGTSESLVSTESLRSLAYQMTGKIKEAKAVLQTGMYKHVMTLFGILSYYLTLCADDIESFEETYKRTLNIMDIFQIEKLHPSTIFNVYMSASQGYLANGKIDETLQTLEKYTKLATDDIYPLQLKGDNFFNLLDSWIDEFPLGTILPRDEKLVKKSIADGVINNPSFSTIADDPHFKNIVEKLKNIC